MVRDVVTVTKDATIRETIKIMYKKHIGSVMITDKEKCKGIFTNTDALRVIVKNIPLDSEVEKAMSKNVLTVHEKDSFSKAKELMRRYRVRHLPVVDTKGFIVGILTLRSLFDEISGLKKSKE